MMLRIVIILIQLIYAFLVVDALNDSIGSIPQPRDYTESCLMACQPRKPLLREKVKIQDKYQTPDHKLTIEGTFKDKLDIVSYKDKRTEYRRNISKNRETTRDGRNLLDDIKNIEVMNNVSFIKNRVKPLIQADDGISNQSFNIIHGAQTSRSKDSEQILFPIESDLNDSKIQRNVKEVLTVKKTNETVKIYAVTNYDTNPKLEIEDDFIAKSPQNYENTHRKDSNSSK